MERYASAGALIARRRPERPVLGLRPHAAARAARWFSAAFPGDVIYALKANDAPEIVSALRGAGVRRFDVASMGEMERLSGVPDLELCLMHPVKPRETVRVAYADHGVRTFALDSEAELDKIGAETGGARDLHLVVRLDCSGAGSLIPLEGKFGIGLRQAPDLLRRARGVAARLGLTLHIGSQAMEPTRFRDMLGELGAIARAAGVPLDHIDVGGGFPSRYANLEPPPLAAYMDAIREGIEDSGLGPDLALSCEPGRALVAEAESVLVRVDDRRGQRLYLNDGAFGTLYDAAHSGFTYPARLVLPAGGQPEALQAFTLFGPTCDSADVIPGPTLLPERVAEGDYVEIGQIGAYGRVLATRFNGFGRYEEAILEDEPMLTMYEGVAPPEAVAEMVPLARAG